MRAESLQAGRNSDSSPYPDIPPGYDATLDPIDLPVNWVLLVGLLGCLTFWGAVVLGIAATV